MSRYPVSNPYYKTKDNDITIDLSSGVTNVNGTLTSMTPAQFLAETGESAKNAATIQKFTVDSGGLNSLVRISSIGDMTFSNNLGVWFYIPWSVDVDNDITDFRFQPATAEWGTLIAFTTPGTYLKNGWNHINFSRSQVGGAWDSISGLQIRFNANTTGVDIYFDSVVAGGRSSVNVLFMQDDGSASSYSDFYGELNSRSLLGTLYLIKDNINVSNITLAHAQELYTNGFDLGQHDTGITNSYVPYTTEELYGLWDTSRDYWLEQGWERGIGHLAYVGGEYDQHVYDAAKAWGMKTARLTKEGYNHISEFGPDDIHLLRTHSLSTGGGITTASAFETALQRAIEAGAGWVSFLIHDIGSAGQMSLAEWQASLDVFKYYKNLGQVTDRTISQAYNSLNTGLSRLAA